MDSCLAADGLKKSVFSFLEGKVDLDFLQIAGEGMFSYDRMSKSQDKRSGSRWMSQDMQQDLHRKLAPELRNSRSASREHNDEKDYKKGGTAIV